MEMFEVQIFDINGNLLRRSLIQAITKDHAISEALNVFDHTPNAATFLLE